MRVLTVGSLYPPYHLGGYELVWQAGVRALRAAGHEVRVVATGDRLGRAAGAVEDPDVHRELRWYWRDHEFPRLGWRARVGLERHNQRVLAGHLAQVRPDVVSWWAMGGMSLSLIETVRRAGIPAIGWVNDGWPVYGPQVDQSHRGPDPLGPALDRWVFCSEAMRRPVLERVPGIASAAVCHQGVAPVFAPAEPHAWGGRLLYAGRIDERKGIGTLVDAVARSEELSARVLGDGDRATLGRLRERAAPAGDRVTFAGAVDRAALAAEYARADAVVFPVEWIEPWGLVPLEAMAVGRPVVATGRGGSGEYLEHEGNALLFEPGDSAALRAALDRLAAEPALRERLRAGGFATAERLTEAAWARAVVAEHEALVAGP